MKLLNELEEVCYNCSHMRDLLIVFSRSSAEQMNYHCGDQQHQKFHEEMKGALELVSQMQKIVADACWDIWQNLKTMTEEEAPIGYVRLTDDEEEILKLFQKLNNFNKESLKYNSINLINMQEEGESGE